MELKVLTGLTGFTRLEAESNPVNPENPVLKNYDEGELIPAVERGERVLERKISNRDRAVGAALSGYLVANHLTTQPSNRLTVNFTGTAGQSFGAFLHHDISFTLDGEANDYVGKSLSGG